MKYYVSTSGNNGWPGTEAQPWRTLTYAASQLIAGDCCVVKDGLYDAAGGEVFPITFSNAGTILNPIRVVGESQAGVILRCNAAAGSSVIVLNAPHLKFDTFTVDRTDVSYGVAFYLNASATDCELAGMVLKRMQVRNSLTGADRFQVYDCRFYSENQGFPSGGLGMLDLNCDSPVVDHCLFITYDNMSGGSAIELHAGATNATINHCTIARQTDNSYSAFASYGIRHWSTALTISECIITHQRYGLYLNSPATLTSCSKMLVYGCWRNRYESSGGTDNWCAWNGGADPDPLYSDALPNGLWIPTNASVLVGDNDGHSLGYHEGSGHYTWGNCDPQPHIDLDKTSLTFVGVQYGELPPAQTFTITNGGGGVLNWSVSCGGETWVIGSPAGPGDNNNQTVTVSVTTTMPGVYIGAATVSSSNADNSGQQILINYTVGQPPWVEETDSPRLEDSIALPIHAHAMIDEICRGGN